VPRPLVQRLHTLFSTARLTRSSLFLDSINEWNEQKHSQCVCVCVCVYIWALRVSRVLSLKRSCRCISHRPLGGKLTIFQFFFFFRKWNIIAVK
jgi:hypothetical protein